MNERIYIQVSDFALSKVVNALYKDNRVTNITVSQEDSSLLVAYNYEDNPVKNKSMTSEGD